MKQKKLTGLKKDSLNLNRLMWVSIKSLLLKKLLKEKETKLPKKVGEYRYIKDFEKIGTARDFKLGIYKNSKGQKAIVKMWKGRIKNFAYYSLQNEITMYTIFNNIITRQGKTIPSKFKNIQIPKLIDRKEGKDFLILMTEFVEGTIVNNLSDAKFKLKVYLLVINYISYLGSKMTTLEKEYCSQRNPVQYFLLYPLLFIKALFTHPRAGVYLILAIPKFIKSLPLLFKSDRKVLTHRDLHFKNIIVSKSKVTLIDLQLCVFTDLMHEYVTTLRYRWLEDNFHKLLLSEIKRQFDNQKNFLVLFSGLGVYSATHGLSGNNFPKVKINYWIEFLKFSINPDFKKAL